MAATSFDDSTPRPFPTASAGGSSRPWSAGTDVPASPVRSGSQPAAPSDLRRYQRWTTAAARDRGAALIATVLLVLASVLAVAGLAILL